MSRVWLILTVCAGLLGSTAPLRAQEPGEAKLRQLAADSRARATGIVVTVTDGNRTTRAAVHADPVMKYTDVPRQIELATLWVWQVDGRPVALGKVEAYHRKEGTKWLYCFASAAGGEVEAKWPDGRLFHARKAGIEWTALTGPTPQPTPAARLRQMKELFQRFAATSRDDVLKTSDELRPLPRPLHEYAAPAQGVSHGVLCGFTANGTNPDVIVALEAVGAADGKGPPTAWRYGVVAMTASGVSVSLDKTEVFTRKYARSPSEYDNWTYFWEGTPKK